MASGFGPAPIMVKIAFGLSIAALLFIIIGMASPYWTDIGNSNTLTVFGARYTITVHYGLWRLCAGTVCVNMNSHGASWFQATQAFVVLGFLASLSALTGTTLYIFIEKLHDVRLYFAAMIADAVTFFCIFIAICVYGAESPNSLSWAYGLTIVGMLFALGACVMLGVNKFRGGDTA